ncbi:MAG: alpha/beta hydrolase [Verrucomicrobia subdivision 3 bacterium]|nr:alpha/beta hydrolase [Limisphaerales bacterium]
MNGKLPLVLLHGYPFDSTMWDPVIARLSPDLKIAAPDLRAFGSPAGTAEPSIDLMADDVALKIEGEAFVAGFSMGGYVTLALAERHPERIAGLALINSQSAADPDEVRQARRAVIEKVSKQGIAAALDAALPKLFAHPTPDLTKYPQRGAERAGVAGIKWALEAMARRPDRMSVLQEFRKPILIVHSTADKFIPVDRAQTLAKSVGATYMEIEGVGHCTPLEAPERVAAALASFLDGR